MDFAYRQYIEDNLPPHLEPVYYEPQWTESLSIDPNPNENRYFIIIHTVVYSIPSGNPGTTVAISDARYATTLFTVWDGVAGNGFYPVKMIIKDNSFAWSLSSFSINLATNYQVVTTRSKVKRVDQ